MVISTEKLNERYLNFCKNRNLDSKEKESTKIFLNYFMSKNKFNHVQQIKDGFEFAFKMRIIKKDASA